jgi:hypothetical protein
MADELHALLRAEGLGVSSRPGPPPVEQSTDPRKKTTRREPMPSRRETTERAIPKRSMSTHGAVATEVSGVPRARRASSRRVLALGMVLLAAASVAFVFRPGPVVDAPAEEQPYTARGAARGVPQATDPAPPAVAAPPSVPPVIETPPAVATPPSQPAVIETPPAVVEDATQAPAVAKPAAPPSRPPAAKKPARKRAASPTPAPATTEPPPRVEPPAEAPAPPASQLDPFSDRL